MRTTSLLVIGLIALAGTAAAQGQRGGGSWSDTPQQQPQQPPQQQGGLFGDTPQSPVQPGAIDFGDDSSNYARDGECDDPRFEGPGMTTTPLLDDDIRADATDCRTAFEAGRIRLRGDAQPPAQPPQVTEQTPPAVIVPPAIVPPVTAAQIDFGDDSNEYANDGECDDRRFRGATMASSLNWERAGRDATDCRTGFESGQLSLWILADAVAATDCAAVDFGDDSGEYTNDDECDDPRFEGLATASILVPDDLGKDASDCRRLCELGVLGLRDY